MADFVGYVVAFDVPSGPWAIGVYPGDTNQPVANVVGAYGNFAKQIAGEWCGDRGHTYKKEKGREPWLEKNHAFRP